MTRKVLAVIMILVVLVSGSTALAAPLVSQSSETQGSSSAVAAPDSAQSQADAESLVVGQMSNETLWIILGVVVVLGIVLVAS